MVGAGASDEGIVGLSAAEGIVAEATVEEGGCGEGVDPEEVVTGLAEGDEAASGVEVAEVAVVDEDGDAAGSGGLEEDGVVVGGSADEEVELGGIGGVGLEIDGIDVDGLPRAVEAAVLVADEEGGIVAAGPGPGVGGGEGVGVGGGMEVWKRCQVAFLATVTRVCCFFGRPGRRCVASRPNDLTTRATHRFWPRGADRMTL